MIDIGTFSSDKKRKKSEQNYYKSYIKDKLEALTKSQASFIIKSKKEETSGE